MIKSLKRKIKKSILKMRAYFLIANKSKPRIIYIGSPRHGNIGDHAISIATKDVLKNIERSVVEIDGELYRGMDEYIKEGINPSDIILITGGGFIGNLWMDEQNMVKSIIKNFPNNKIVIMPQTLFFEENEFGKNELNEFFQLVKSHNNIYILVREQNSYDLCKNMLQEEKHIFLLPDMVLTQKYNKQIKREDCLVILRQDKEKVINKEEIINKLKNYNIKETSTVINRRINFRQRIKIFEAKLNEFSNSKLVVTDRLHAMIFSAITSTPCVALDNSSKKVSGVYKWLEDVEYIKFCKDISDLEKSINELDLNKSYNYNKNDTYKYKIIECLNLIINNK